MKSIAKLLLPPMSAGTDSNLSNRAADICFLLSKITFPYNSSKSDLTIADRNPVTAPLPAGTAIRAGKGICMRAAQTALTTCIVSLVLWATPAGAEMAMLKPGYVACENLSSAEMMLKAARTGNGFISGETLRDNRCVRTQDLAGLKMEVVERRKNHCLLLLRAEKAGQRDAEFWASDVAVHMLKPKGK